MEYFPHSLSLDESNAFFDRIIEGWRRGYGLWAIERRDDESFIGFVGLTQPQWEAHFTPCIEIGWRLSAPSWGQGLASEGANATLTWAKRNVDFPRGEVVSFTTISNTRSRRVMEKLGMTHDASDDFDHPAVLNWSGCRHVLYRLKM